MGQGGHEGVLAEEVGGDEGGEVEELLERTGRVQGDHVKGARREGVGEVAGLAEVLQACIHAGCSTP